MALALNREELAAYLEEVFPQVRRDFVIEALDEETITMRLVTAERHLRPGGTVSGPSMFALADVCVYAMVLARVGKQALAVTTGCSMDFMRKPDGGRDVIAQGRLLKLGKSMKTLFCNAGRHRQEVDRDRRRGRRSGPSRLDRRHAAARQAQAVLHAAHGHGRQRHHHQRRQGAADRQEAPTRTSTGTPAIPAGSSRAPSSRSWRRPSRARRVQAVKRMLPGNRCRASR
jgi:uncharacterized protein (TIGR00369 family)